jgi:hypothetical protein
MLHFKQKKTQKNNDAYEKIRIILQARDGQTSETDRQTDDRQTDRQTDR